MKIQIGDRYKEYEITAAYPIEPEESHWKYTYLCDFIIMDIRKGLFTNTKFTVLYPTGQSVMLDSSWLLQKDGRYERIND